VFGFESIEFEESAVGVEDGEWQGFGESDGFGGIKVGSSGTFAAEDGESALPGDDFAAGDAFGSMRPRRLDFGPVEEHRQDPEHVFPVARVIGLEDKFSAGLECTVGQQQKFGRDQSSSDLIASVPWLGVVAMNFGNGILGCVERQKFAAANDGPAGVQQSALIGAAGGVANDDWQYVDAEAVVFRVGESEVQQRASVSAADIENNGGIAAEQ